ncbi:MAG: hypothetical protein EA402_00435 [Planctomycetota bacterium]|nr:MAG: hypothetical protein EA402_00435 [Planctomycetota bacterium]
MRIPANTDGEGKQKPPSLEYQEFHVSRLPSAQPLLQELTNFLIQRARIRYGIWVLVGRYDINLLLGARPACTVGPVIRYKPAQQVTGIESTPVPIHGRETDRNGKCYIDRPGFYLTWMEKVVRTSPAGKKFRAYGKQFPVPMRQPYSSIPAPIIAQYVTSGLDGSERSVAEESFATLWDAINGAYEGYKAMGKLLTALGRGFGQSNLAYGQASDHVGRIVGKLDY